MVLFVVFCFAHESTMDTMVGYVKRLLSLPLCVCAVPTLICFPGYYAGRSSTLSPMLC